MDFKSINLNNFQALSKDEFANITKNYSWHQVILACNKSNKLFAIIRLGEKVKKKSTNQLILERLDKIDDILNNIESKVDKIDERLNNLESEARKHGWNI